MNQISFPTAFELRMREYLGEKWEDFASAHEKPSPVSIRINPSKSKNKTPGNPVPWGSNAYYLDERPSFTLDPTFHAGSYYVQEASSMFLEQAFIQTVDQTKALNVLDLCAAPGGKSTHLISLMNKQTLLVSNEVIRSRASVLAENIQKWGYNNVVVTNNDPQDFQRIPGFFDVIVLDAPCSGEGLFRKDPNAMHEWSNDNVALCSKRQRRILSDIWPALKEGGILIYSTCTYNQSENEDNLKWLKQERDVEFISLALDSGWGVEVVEHQTLRGYRFLPHNAEGEGFFLSVIKKTSSEKESRSKYKNVFAAPPKKILEQLTSWVVQPDEKTFVFRNDQVQAFPKNKIQEIEQLAKNTYIITAGTILASVKHDKLIPEHSAALSTELNRENFNVIKVNLEEALQYLRKETMQLMSNRKGFALIEYDGHPLGWVNVLDNRMNNLYPSGWRVRMTDKST